MAIGTAAAIGLGLGAVGSVISSSSQRKAANKAADVSQQNNAQNTALQREVYGQNKAALSPFMARGNAAGDQINALLGLAPQQTQQPNALSQYAASPVINRGQFRADLNFNGSPLSSMGGPFSPVGDSFVQMDAQGVPTAVPHVQQQANPQQSAFDVFRNSTGYQFRLNEGMDALNSGYAGAGVIRSGAAMKAAQEYGQNFASNEFGNYMGYLANQQGVGLSGASALAGVGQSYANNVSAQNTQNAANIANAALAKGSNNPWGNMFGMAGGALYGLGS